MIPVSNFTYVYLVFMITEALFCLMAIIKNDEEKFSVHLLTTGMMTIGYMCNRYYSMQYFPF